MTRRFGPGTLGVVLALLTFAESAAASGRVTGLPVPRFVTIKAKPANVRVGPGVDYPIRWRFVRRGLPVEVITEYGNWRKIRDSDGAEGWILAALLSGKRSVVVAPWSGAERVEMRARRKPDARVVAVIEPNVLAVVSGCNGEWCHVKAGGIGGYVQQTRLWGVYPGEAF